MTPKLSQYKIFISILAFALLAGTITASQYFRGVFSSELMSDANGHYVTTLLAHDYIRNIFPGNPIAYAVEYFTHYPSIRIGNNPPTFYALSSLWALITSDSIAAALTLSAILGAVYCLIIFFWFARLQGLGAGIVVAIFVALLPTFQRVAGSFLIDIPIGIFSLPAAIFYAKFLNQGARRPAVLFSIFATLALLIKLSALFLAVMVPLAILISGKFLLLRNKYFWLPVLIIGISTLPWYVLTLETATGGATERDITYPLVSLYGYLSIFAANFTLPGLVLVLAGLVDRLRFIRANKGSIEADQWSVIIALAVSVPLFQIFIPANILERYMITALGPLMMLLWPGAAAIGNLAARQLQRHALISEKFSGRIPYAILAVVLGVICVNAIRIEPAPSNQMAQAAQKASESLPARNPIVLVASHGRRESSFIAQLASRDKSRPSMFAVRGSRLFGKKEGFMNVDYAPKYNSPDEVLRELEKLSIAMIVLDRSAEAQMWQHNKDLAWLADNKPELWRQIWSMDNPGGDGTLSLLIMKSAETKTLDKSFLIQEFRPRSGKIGTAE